MKSPANLAQIKGILCHLGESDALENTPFNTKKVELIRRLVLGSYKRTSVASTLVFRIARQAISVQFKALKNEHSHMLRKYFSNAEMRRKGRRESEITNLTEY